MNMHFVYSAFFRQLSLTGFIFLMVLNVSCQKAGDKPEAGAKPSDFSIAMHTKGNKTVSFPAEDPGAPVYARFTPILNQVFTVDGWVVIPFYRDPACIRPDFNLLDGFDVPASFGCALTCSGQYVIEADAPMGTFPIIVQTRSEALPIWWITAAAYQTAAMDGVITIGELNAAVPVKATATQFEEMLRPRMENHHVVINAEGTIDANDKPFSFSVNHPGNTTRSISLVF